MADMSDNSGIADLDVDFEDATDPHGTDVFVEPGVQEAAGRFASQIAEQARQEFAQRTDPFLQHQADEAEAAHAETVAAASQVVEQHPWTSDEGAARYLVGEARRAAVALGDPALADQPTFWGEVASAVERGVRGSAIARDIENQRVKDAIGFGNDAGGLGRNVLPFG